VAWERRRLRRAPHQRHQKGHRRAQLLRRAHEHGGEDGHDAGRDELVPQAEARFQKGDDRARLNEGAVLLLLRWRRASVSVRGWDLPRWQERERERVLFLPSGGRRPHLEECGRRLKQKGGDLLRFQAVLPQKVQPALRDGRVLHKGLALGQYKPRLRILQFAFWVCFSGCFAQRWRNEAAERQAAGRQAGKQRGMAVRRTSCLSTPAANRSRTAGRTCASASSAASPGRCTATSITACSPIDSSRERTSSACVGT